MGRMTNRDRRDQSFERAQTKVRDQIVAYYQAQPSDWLRRCAENEGGRALLALKGYADIHTAYYFAREAARYALVLLDREQGA